MLFSEEINEKNDGSSFAIGTIKAQSHQFLNSDFVIFEP
jgi:hypothetical protein